MTYSRFIRVGFDAVVGAAHGGAGASYAALGSATTNPVYSIIISSTYNQSVFLSIDGTTDHLFIPSATVVPVEFGSNKEGTGKFILPVGTQFYLKQGPDGAPTSGDIYISFLSGR